MTIKVLLADHTEITRKAMRLVLEAEPEIEVVGEAMDFAQTIQLTKVSNPHVLVLDLHMPDHDSVTPIDFKAHLEPCTPRLVAVSVWDDDETKALAASFEVVRLLDKASLGTELVPAIRKTVSTE